MIHIAFAKSNILVQAYFLYISGTGTHGGNKKTGCEISQRPVLS